MKIKLLFDVPVDKKHGMVKDRVLEVVKEDLSIYKKRGNKGYWVQGDAGERVKIRPHEAQVMS